MVYTVFQLPSRFSKHSLGALEGKAAAYRDSNILINIKGKGKESSYKWTPR